MSARVLVTGALGYIGGRLIRHLAAEPGFIVRAGLRNPSRANAVLPGQCEAVRMDLLETDSLKAACAGIDIIVHLAALNDPDCRASPENAFRVNCLGTHNLVSAARLAGVRRMVYVSTAHVYGSPLAGEIDETNIPHPVSLYALTHRCAEDVVLAASAESRGAVIRLSNGFGAPAHPDVNAWMLLANDLCRQAVEHGRLVLQSSGLHWRDFVTMTDVTRGIAHVMRMPESAVGEGVFNLGGDCVLRVNDLCELVRSVSQRILGFSPEIKRPGASRNFPVPEKFSYRIDRLRATGFELLRDMEGEIEGLLRFCERHFGRSRNPDPKGGA